MLRPTYPAKILLLGEYTIINGSKALALPYWKFSGRWTFDTSKSSEREFSRSSLKSFLQHPSDQYLDLVRLKEDVEKGLWFDSSIPQGFGLGSSGALISAIYDAYGKQREDEKNSLARLEDFFHGSSSGIDPLVSHLQRPLLIHSADEVQVLKEELKLSGFFLLNTQKPRKTGPLVNIYKEKLKDPQFQKGCGEVLSKDVNFAIDALLKEDPTHLQVHLYHISKFQWDFFQEMIPLEMRALWHQGLETGDYVLKLCGAGGGGFILGYSEKFSVKDLAPLMKGHELLEL